MSAEAAAFSWATFSLEDDPARLDGMSWAFRAIAFRAHGVVVDTDFFVVSDAEIKRLRRQAIAAHRR